MYIARVRHGGIAYTVEAEAERSDGKLVGLFICPTPDFDSIPTVLDKAGKALYVAAVRAYTAGDIQTHKLLICASGSIATYARGLRRAMDSDQAA
jgi:hypothetical protein